MSDDSHNAAEAGVAGHAASADPKEEGTKDQHDGLVHITEGYYKYTNILFDWPKYMNIWHVSPLVSTRFSVRVF